MRRSQRRAWSLAPYERPLSTAASLIGNGLASRERFLHKGLASAQTLVS